MKQNSKRSFKSPINYAHLHAAKQYPTNAKELQDEATKFLRANGYGWNGKEIIVSK